MVAASWLALGLAAGCAGTRDGVHREPFQIVMVWGGGVAGGVWGFRLSEEGVARFCKGWTPATSTLADSVPISHEQLLLIDSLLREESLYTPLSPGPGGPPVVDRISVTVTVRYGRRTTVASFPDASVAGGTPALRRLCEELRSIQELAKPW